MKVTKNIIQGFMGSVLSHGFDDGVASPPFHEEAWDICTGPDKYVALAAPRG